jgi:hypothetical protein
MDLFLYEYFPGLKNKQIQLNRKFDETFIDCDIAAPKR